MALDSWLIKLRSAFSPGRRRRTDRSVAAAAVTSADGGCANIVRRRTNKIGILAFEVSSLMSKLLRLWGCLSDAHLARLRRDSIALPGGGAVRELVSDDDALLLALACAEHAESLSRAAASISALAVRCADARLRSFGRSFEVFAETGDDAHGWAMSWKEMEAKSCRRMQRYVSATALLCREMELLFETEEALEKLTRGVGADDERRKKLSAPKIDAAISDLRQKLFWQNQEVMRLKEASLWGRSFDVATTLLARSAFTVLSRLKHVFGLAGCSSGKTTTLACPLPRGYSSSAAVHPSSDDVTGQAQAPVCSSSGQQVQDRRFFDIISAAAALRRPPPNTLGAAALDLRYANLIILIEKMSLSPRSMRPDARDDLYAMLPASVRSVLRCRLRGAGRGAAARDAGTAAERRAAVLGTLSWLAPLAHNTVEWQADRSFEQRRGGAEEPDGRQVLLLQTLRFADREKTEATVVELLVGLDYVWRFERGTTRHDAGTRIAFR